MRKLLSKFYKSESGAISADWVALTAAGMLLAVAVGGILNTSAVDAGDQLGENVAGLATE